MDPGERAVVLVADDDVETRELLCELLEAEGFRPLRAYNGREAMLFLHAHAPQLVVLDLAMPEMTGWDVLEAMKKSPELARVPVLVVAGRPLRSSGLRRADVAAYLQKPVDVDHFRELVAALRRVASGRVGPAPGGVHGV